MKKRIINHNIYDVNVHLSFDSLMSGCKLDCEPYWYAIMY